MRSIQTARLSPYVAALNALNEDKRLRCLKPRVGIDFASNDYLALGNASRIKKAMVAALEAGTPVGAGGSRLLRGNCEEHERLETEAAQFFGAEAALFFGGGYIANFALLTTLPQRGDLLVLDSLVHASIHEGARAGRAECRIHAHNDPQSVEDAIRAWRNKGGAGRVWIVAESLYSMDGDFAPLEELVAIADRQDAFLIVDEAHATGAYGHQGRGLTAPYDKRENLIVVHTCGKALGAAGALVTASGILRDFMVNRCRPFIFATAPSPLMAVAVREALLTLQKEPERQQRLAKLVAFAHRQITSLGLRTPSTSQIVPYIVGDNAHAMRLASALQARGFDIRGIRPPTVPAGTARLRISLTLNVGEADVRAMLDALVEVTRGSFR
ncbi:MULTISPECIES: 8-amino-7-oxononanoate synthase [Bradyrhizobium]|jgi:8-amino-7-oxononanoate synthase|uniref:8-amino-7-oxononanoate synthase n=3 Tax=Bradyrhizobium TaxID=374 RepID=H7C6S8_BRADU|nr:MULTISPECIES: 8-amino-7-oxononanoate synthase [Bradyrhizobium]AAG61072.1 ID901 [Bradyrhizobium japonicum]AHY48707.1 8-amino-7-oxononanoate synthase [Bradyrhizobium japonicum SEMIA 5079]AJA65374.1 8-amino-7-oxononanoate synthase [Bradyrhizobium japonicum]AND87637.1 8-amino-7-oxononanoate synthase [Bradyrhizobium diazoefficiens USDA 110]APG14726.1 8-amino-7-oxononanoate synthase [Bradyrhizobium japonicum]